MPASTFASTFALRGPSTVRGGLLAALLGACAAPSPIAPGVALAPDSPWPKFRASAAQDGRGRVKMQPGGKAFDLRTGKGIFSSPVVAGDGTIYIGSADRYFYALDPAGNVRWKLLTGEIIDSAALLDDKGRLYFGSGDGKLRALDAATGAPVWTFTADDPAETKAFIRWFEGNVAIATDGTLYAPNDNFYTYALDRDTGVPRWRFLTGDQTWSLPAVDAASGRLYMGNNNVVSVYGDNVYGIKPDGTKDWGFLTLGTVAASPLLDGDQVLVGSYDGYLYSFDAQTGNVRWKLATRDHLYASPALLPDGTIIQPSADGTVYALGHDGAVRWTYETTEPVRSSPAVDTEGHIYLGTGEGALLVLNPDGTLRYQVALIGEDRNDLNSSPALGRDAIYLGGESGEFFSIPYDHCLTSEGAADARCTTTASGGEASHGLYFTTAFGKVLPAGPDTIDPNQPLTFSLRVRKDGQAIIPYLDSSDVQVTVAPPVKVTAQVSGDGKFLTVTPDTGFVAGSDGKVTITVAAGYLVDTERAGLKVSGGRPGGRFVVTRSPTLSAPPSAPFALAVPVRAGDAATTWEMARLAVPLPTLLPSYDQIGFDSFHWLIGLVEWDGARGLAWMVGARLAADENRTVIDPTSKTLMPLEVRYDGGAYLTLSNQAGLRVVINNVEIPFRTFRIAAALGSDGKGTARLTGNTLCTGIPVYGGFLEGLGLCNTATHLMSIAGAANLFPASGGPITGPAGVGTVTWSASKDQVTATLAGSALLTGEHLVGIVLVDDATGKPVTLDYGPGTRRTSDDAGRLGAVALPLTFNTLPTTVPARVRAHLMVDTYPAASTTLTIN